MCVHAMTKVYLYSMHNFENTVRTCTDEIMKISGDQMRIFLTRCYDRIDGKPNMACILFYRKNTLKLDGNNMVLIWDLRI